MREDSIEDIANTSEKPVDGISRPNSLYQAVYRAVLVLDKQKNKARRTKNKLQMYEFVFCQSYYAVCLISYIDVTEVTGEESSFWSVFRWVRMDYLLTWANMSDSLLYLAWLLVSVHVCGLALVLVRPRRIRTAYLPVMFPMLNARVAAVAEVALFAVLMSRAANIAIGERPGQLIANSGDPPMWTCSVSLAMYCLYLPLQFLRVLRSAQFQHSRTREDLTCSAGVMSELVRVAAMHGVTVSYFTLAGGHPEVHLLLVACVHSVYLLFVYLRTPYFSPCVTGLMAAQSAFLLSSAAFVLWGTFLRSLLFASFAIVFLAPALSTLVYWNMESVCIRLGHYYESRLFKTLSVYQLELALRSRILQCVDANTAAESVLRDIAVLDFKARQRKLKRLRLWATDIALNVMRNETLARVKLAQAAFAVSSFEDDFVEARLRRDLAHRKQSEALEYLNYIQRIRAIKAADKNLCHILLALYSELSCRAPEGEKILRYSQIIHREVRMLTSEYEEFLQTFPKMRQGYQIYASFLDDICHLTEKAETTRLQGNVIKDCHGEGADVSLFNIDTGIVIISCSPVTPGQISYANDQAHVVLGYPMGSMVGSNFSALIPRPYRERHGRKLAEFLRFAATTDIRHPSTLYICNYFGVILECFASVVMTAALGPPVFVLAFRSTQTQRDFAIVSDEGVVTAASCNFASRIGCVEVVGQSLTHLSGFLPAPQRPSSTSLLPTGVLAMPITRHISSVPISLIYVFSPEEDSLSFNIGSVTNRSNHLESDGRAETFSILSRTFENTRRKSSVQFGPSVNTDNEFKAAMTKGLQFSVRDSFLVAGSGASFTRSLEGRKRVARIRGSVKVVQAVVIVMVAMLAAGNIVVGTFVTSEVNQTISNDLTKYYALRELEVSKIAQNARYIQMTAYLGVGSSAATRYKSQINSSAENLISIQSKLLSDATSDELQATVLIWELLDGEVHQRHVTLLDAVRLIIDHAMTIQNYDRKELISGHPSMFYLFRNGLGETRRALQQSEHNYILRSKRSIENSTSMSSTYFLPPLFVLLVAVPLLIFHLSRVNTSLNALTHTLLSYQINTYIELKQPIVDRLSFYYGEEPNVGQALMSSVSNRKRHGSLMHKAMVVICVFSVCSLLAYAVEYFYIVQKTSDSLLIWPTMIELAVGRITTLVSIWTWMLEGVFYSVPFVSIKFLPGYSLVPSPFQEVRNAYSSLDRLKNDMLSLTLSSRISISDSHFRYAYDSIVSNCSYLRLGFDSGFDRIKDDTMYIALDQSQADFYPTYQSIYVELVDLNTACAYVCEEEIVSTADRHIDQYYTDITDSLQQWLLAMKLALVLHSGVCCSLFALAMMCGVTKVQREARAVWKVLSFFPQEVGVARKSLRRL